jgi:8-oxo-dGTP pyrophosphatase MutT (NUDIX family)
MIFSDSPTDFQKKIDIVACFVEKGDSILLLHRQSHKPQGGQWGIPAGKVDNGENLEGAMRRELFEETGIRTNKLTHWKEIPTRYPDFDFLFHVFVTTVGENTQVCINPEEHIEYCWIKPLEVTNLTLMEDIGDVIAMYYK